MNAQGKRDLVAAASFAVQMHQTFLDGRNPASDEDIDRMYEEAYAVAECFEDAARRASKTPDPHKREVENAFRDGWENGWDTCRHKVRDSGTTSVVYGSDDFDPDWDDSQTKKKLEE